MNPMLVSLNRGQAQPGILNQVGQLKTLVGAAKNPGGVIQNGLLTQIQNHPLFSQAKAIADRFGGDWNRAFEETAKQNGMDPNQIRELLRQQGLIP